MGRKNKDSHVQYVVLLFKYQQYSYFKNVVPMVNAYFPGIISVLPPSHLNLYCALLIYLAGSNKYQREKICYHSVLSYFQFCRLT